MQRGNVTDSPKKLAERFEENRAHLAAVAYRMLGSATEADDAVQESWMRLGRTETRDVENLRAWLTTVVARVCLDMLRSRKSRREEPLDIHVTGPGELDPEREVLMADSVGLALQVVLETLTPSERLAFVLHDMFAMPFDEIAPIVGRTPTATRQLASRARRRVHRAETPGAGVAGRREIVDAFLAASRRGDFAALVELLDPDVVMRSDAVASAMGAGKEVRGARPVADVFSGRARVATPAYIDGEPGLVWSSGGKPKVVFVFEIEGGRILAIDLIADPARHGEMELEVLTEP